MHVAMISPPWIATPPQGYGGIEYVVHHLTIELVRLGHRVTLFATGDSTTPASDRHATFSGGQYERISDPLYDVVSIPLAHTLDALNRIRQLGDVDIIHDHTAPIGPALLAHADPRELPPSVHTLHGPLTTTSSGGVGLTDDRRCYDLAASSRIGFIGISRAQLRAARPEMRAALLGVVHNGLDLAEFAPPGDAAARRADGPFLTLARIARCKGHHTAARLARELGVPLRIAGMVPGYTSLEQLEAPPAPTDSPDLTYFRTELQPLVEPGVVELVGPVAGATKQHLLQEARALLFPIEWEEPFGLAAIEALACGTPVVAMRRGALAEIVEHGVTGFLADDERSFLDAMRHVDEIDPDACRRSVVERFSSARMARGYLQCYELQLERAARAGAALSSAGRAARLAATAGRPPARKPVRA
jgi:glycosyltransferase involved in cell wall biosynthesis